MTGQEECRKHAGSGLRGLLEKRTRAAEAHGVLGGVLIEAWACAIVMEACI